MDHIHHAVFANTKLKIPYVLY